MNKNQISSLIYILFMGLGYPLIRYVSTIFSAENTNALMFLSGGLLFFMVSLIKFREEVKKIKDNLWLFPRLTILACFTAGNMYCFVAGLSKTSALAGSIFGILAMPFSVVFAGILFADEREKIKDVRFIIGAILALIGSFIFVFSGVHTSSSSSQFLFGIILLSGTIILQALQSFVVKDTSTHIHSIVISSCSSLITSLIFFIISIVSGNISELINASSHQIFTVVGVGIYAIFVGMFMTFFIIQNQGVVVLNVLKLIIPPATAIIGYFFLKEKITFVQGIGSIFVLIGCTLALKKKKS